MVLKCKMCGGDITPIKNTNTGKCEFCKSVMTLPNLDNEKIVNLYNRANFLRLENEFDKAKETYENILEIDNKQIEAHWGLLLCKYGVEYVDDPKTKKKIPTCHRTNDTSILSEKEFKIIKKEAYGDALNLYQEEAKIIDEIQKNILSISLKEKPYDVFICYKETDDNNERTKDSVIAEDIYDKLKELGLKVFFARITLEKKLGQEYEPYIYSALKSSKVMLVVGTEEKNFNAIWVKNEWSRYLEMMKQEKGKTLIPVYSKIDAYKLPEEFAMLQAQSMDKIGAIQDLTKGVKKIVEEYKTEEVEGIDKETILKVSQALEEAKSIGNGMYEVNIIKENLPIWYYILCIGTIVFYSFNRLLAIFDVFPISLLTLEPSPLSHHIIISLFELLNTVLLFCYVIFLSVNRKTHKIAKRLFPVLICLLCIKPAIYLSQLLIPRNLIYIIINYGFDFVMLLVSHFIIPKWNLNTSSKSIMNQEEKEKQMIKNKQIKEAYKQKESNKDNHFSKKTIFLLILVTISIYMLTFICVWKKLPYRQSNEKDNSVTQISVLGNKKVYASESLNEKILTTVRTGDYYTILNFEEIKQNSNLSLYGFVKIKTKKGIVGYLYLGEEQEDAYVGSAGYDYKIVCGEKDIICQNKFTYSNIRDTSVNQLEIITETLNLRKDHSRYEDALALLKQGEIYTILDTYVEEIKGRKYNENWFETNTDMYYEVVLEKRNWYKIKTSNGIEGWICGNEKENSYVSILNAK